MRNVLKLAVVSLVLIAGGFVIAGKDGVALEWRPLNGVSDLPKFVHSVQDLNKGLRHPDGKLNLTAVVRMETPVIYFYPSREMDVSAKVEFPKGKLTEWYPQARALYAGNVDWGRIKIQPGAAFNLPADYSDNHYYAARETDAAPLQVCATNGNATEQEKFLFYRGVGNFDLPLAVTLENDRVTLRNTAKDPIAQLIVFENQDGRIGFRTVDNLSDLTTVDPPSLDQSTDAVMLQLKQLLVASGLYDKESDAMIKTWRNSWFEPGMRVFYILPRPTTDSVLRLTIDPRPDELVRVLV